MTSAPRNTPAEGTARPWMHSSGRVLIAIGANQAGRWGAPDSTISTALAELASANIVVVASSSRYVTAPLGGGRQRPYVNLVVVAHAPLGPARLLERLKALERAAGRTRGRRWGPRPLDMDIVHAGRGLMHWPPPRRRDGTLILPHPEAHRRLFVLAPLAEVAPDWIHPAHGVRPGSLLRRLGLAPIAARRMLRRV